MILSVQAQRHHQLQTRLLLDGRMGSMDRRGNLGALFFFDTITAGSSVYRRGILGGRALSLCRLWILAASHSRELASADLLGSAGGTRLSDVDPCDDQRANEGGGDTVAS